MRKLQHLLGGLKLAQFKKFTALLPKTRTKYDQALAWAATNREKFEKLLPPDFSWALLYELQAKEMFILSLAALGRLDSLSQAARAGLDLNQFLMDETIREEESGDDEIEWSGGHGGRPLLPFLPPSSAVNSAQTLGFARASLVSSIFSATLNLCSLFVLWHLKLLVS